MMIVSWAQASLISPRSARAASGQGWGHRCVLRGASLCSRWDNLAANRPYGLQRADMINLLSRYEQHALREIHAWKNPRICWFGKAMKVLNWPLAKAGDLIFATPGVGEAIRNSIQGLTGVCNDLTQWSAQPEVIYEDFQEAGHPGVNNSADVFTMELEHVDRVVAGLDVKYKSIALVEGAGTGYAGFLGIPTDIVALITLNLRAVAEYATYYGFDVSSQEERLFVMNVLGLASSPTDAARLLAMAQLVRIAEDVANKRSWTELEHRSFDQLIQRLAKPVGIRLTKAKLAQVVPVAGAAVGSGFNACFTAKVCDAAYYLYRERFLAAKHGPDVIEKTVEPAQDFDPHYPKEEESVP